MTNARRVCLSFLPHELGHEAIAIRYKIPVVVNSHCQGMLNRSDLVDFMRTWREIAADTSW